MKIINEPDMWCPSCENHELEVSGSEILPIYTCTQCKKMMWPIDRPLLTELNKKEEG